MAFYSTDSFHSNNQDNTYLALKLLAFLWPGVKRVDPGGARGSVLGELGVIFETSSRDPEGDCDTLGGSIRSESLQQAMEGKPLIQQYSAFFFFII